MSVLTAPLAWDWQMLVHLFGVMALSCLFSFGGANGPLIVVQDRLVDTGLLDVQPFAFLVGLVYMLPGPKATFVSGVGFYIAGIPGAIAAMLGLVIPTVIGSAAANRALVRMQTIVDKAKPATGYVLAGIIAATAYSTAGPLAIGPVAIVAIAVAAYLVAWRDIEPLRLILVALAVGGVRSALAHFG
jgi:chromate transporter